MKIELSDKAAEIIKYVANLHHTDFQFLMEQIVISQVECFVSDLKYFSPKRRGNLFEDKEYPCSEGVTIDDCYQEFKELEEAIEIGFGI